MAKRPPADMCPRPGAVRFFEQNAGGSRRAGESRRMGTRRSARALAVAECVADREGAEVEWSIDQDADRSEAELAAEAFADEIEPIERRLETRRGRPMRLGRR